MSKLKVKLVNTVLRVSVTADSDASDAAHNHRRRHCPMSERVVQSALRTAGYALTVATYTAIDNTAVLHQAQLHNVPPKMCKRQ